MSLLAEIIYKEGFSSFANDTFDQYVEKLNSINFSDVDSFPMTTKGRSILYYTMSLLIFPSDNPNDERRRKLNESL